MSHFNFSKEYSILIPILSTIFTSIFLSTVGSNVCKEKTKDIYDDSIELFTVGEMYAFFSNSILLIVRMISSQNRIMYSEKTVKSSINYMYGFVLCVNLQAGTSAYLKYTGYWGGLCEDNYGVILPKALWAQWLADTPLITLISVIENERMDSLCFADVAIIVFTELSIVFGFLMSCKHSDTLYWIWCCLSYGSYFCTYYFAFGLPSSTSMSQVSQTVETELDFLPEPSFNESMEAARNFTRASRALKLKTLLLIVLPPIPILYALAMLKILDHNSTFLWMSGANTLLKFVFTSLVCDIHVGLVDDIVYFAEVRANIERRNFLRYIFHEVRVPLNSLVLGLSALKQIACDDVGDSGVSQLSIIDELEDSTTFMTDTLNDVLSMQKIEEGALEFTMVPFSIAELLQQASHTVGRSISDKKINLVVTIEPDVPPRLIGDHFRIVHVLLNLVTNAVKFSKPETTITILVSLSHAGVLKHSTPPSSSDNLKSALSDQEGHNKFFNVDSSTPKEISMSSLNLKKSRELISHISKSSFRKDLSKSVVILLSVTDEGPGISPHDMKNLFNPFQQIRPYETQEGKGSGLGLAISRKIINLHGGELSCTSDFGVGATFKSYSLSTFPVEQ